MNDNEWDSDFGPSGIEHQTNPVEPTKPYIFLENGSLLPGKDTILIAVMGVTGSGKSRFINNIKATRIQQVDDEAGPNTEKYAKVGETLESETKSIEFFHLPLPNQDVILIDTPGFNDKDRSDTDILQELANWLTDICDKERLLSGICYMHRINETRFDASASENTIMLQKLCGRAGMEIVKLVTTFWDESLDQPQVEASFSQREKLLRDKYWADLLDDGASMVRSYNDRETIMACIESFVGHQRKILALQRQIVTEKRSLAGTDIGAHLMRKVRKFESELNTKLLELEELEKQRRQEGGQPSKLLAKQRKKIEKDLEEARNQQRDLENWTGATKISALTGAMGGTSSFIALCMLEDAALLSVTGAVAFPVLAGGLLAGASVGGLWWYKKWKAKKARGENNISNLERKRKDRVTAEQEAETSEKQDLRNSYEVRMTMVDDLLSETWYTKNPIKPKEFQESLLKTLPPNKQGLAEHILVCGWELPIFCQELLPADASTSLETLLPLIQQSIVIVRGPTSQFETSTIGSHLVKIWGESGMQILRSAVHAVCEGINDHSTRGLPLAGTWPSDLLDPYPVRLYAYSTHAILQLSTDRTNYDVLEQNKDTIQALLWICQATRMRSEYANNPPVSLPLQKLEIEGSNEESLSKEISLYPLTRMVEEKTIDSNLLGAQWSSIFKKAIVVGERRI